MYGTRRSRFGSTASSTASTSSSGSRNLGSISEDSLDSYTSYASRRYTLDTTPQQPYRKRLESFDSSETKHQRNISRQPSKSPAVYMQRCSSSVVVTDSYRNGNDVREKLRKSRLHAKSVDIVGKFKEEPSEEILTPFEAVRGLKRDAPAYWISSSYAYHSKTKTMDLTVRQTGVLPDQCGGDDISKLTLELTLLFANSRKQKKDVVLKRSLKDNSFRSSHVSFSNIAEKDSKIVQVRFRIFNCRWLSKRKVAEWTMPLNDCHERPKTQWKRVTFEERL